MKKFILISVVLLLAFLSSFVMAAENCERVPAIDFLTWIPAKYKNYYESSAYVAEEWRKLGVQVNLNQSNFPNPMLGLWFKEHNFDAVYSVLSGLPYRMEPDFFTYSQFNSKNANPGNWNVGEWSHSEFDKIGAQQLEVYDPAKRKRLIDKLQKILHEEQPEAIVNFTTFYAGMNTKRFDLDYTPSADGVRSIWNLTQITPKGSERVVKIGRVADQATWNPLAAIQSDDFEMLRMVYDRLIQVGPQGEVKMWAAQSVNRVEDTVIDVVLREDLEFSDGVPLTAEDVKFTYEFTKKWEAPYFLKYLKPIQNIEVLDKYKVRFHLEKPFAPFIMNTLGQVFIIPKHIWSTVVEKNGLEKPHDHPNIPLIGSGAYQLDYWKEAAEVSFKANPDHFMKPKADILIIVFGAKELINSALMKGTIDISFQGLPTIGLDDFRANKDIKLFKVNSNGYDAVRFQTNRPIFKHKALRVALSYAIPRKKIIEEVHGGLGGVTPSGITPVNAFWHNNNLKVRDFDLEKSRQILRDDGFHWNDQGQLCFPNS